MKFWPLYILAISIGLAQESQPTFSIGGKVVNAVSAETLSSVRVTILTAEAKSRKLQAMTTKGDGIFQFRLEKGSYFLQAERNEFGRQTYGNKRLYDTYGVSIIAGAGNNNEDLLFRLFPPAAISGQVLDQNGEPVEQALVHLVRYAIWEGKKRPLNRGFSYTNDKGEYRIGNLEAGAYYIVVGGTPWQSRLAFMESDETRAQSPAYLPVYYPNSTNPGSAVPLKIQAGEEAKANFTITDRAGTSIRVRVDGDLKPGARIQLKAEGVEGVSRFQYASSLIGNEALLPAVPPGRFELEVLGESKGKPVAGTTKFEAEGRHLTVRVAVAPLASIQGRVSCDGKPVVSANPSLISLFRPSDGRGFSVWLQPDGSFQVGGLSPGAYIPILGASSGCYAARVIVNGKELADRTFDLGADAIRGVLIESVSGLAEVKGFVRKGKQPLSGHFVFLVAIQDSQDPSLQRSFMTDSDGSYRFSGIKPGDYWIFSTDDTDIEYANRKAIQPYLKNAEKISILPRGEHEMDLEIRDK